MSWPVIIESLFDQALPLGTVALLVWIATMLKHIKESLNNHITDTNKKIDKLDAKIEKNTDTLEGKIEKNTDTLKAGQSKLDTKIDNKIDKLDTKIDNKIDKLDTKIDKLLPASNQAQSF